MAQEKKRRGRRAHLDDFQKTATGDYIYTGQLHPFKPGAFTRRQALLRLWLAAAGLAAVLVAAGCIPVAGMRNTFYVILPYAASLLAAASVVWLMCRLTAGGDPLTVVNNLSDFIFGLIRAVGIILLGWGVVQVGLSFQSHDPSQRSQGFLTLAGGIVITFAKEILDLITGA